MRIASAIILRISSVLIIAVCLGCCSTLKAQNDKSVEGSPAMDTIPLTKEHIAAVNRERRVIFHHDVLSPYVPFGTDGVGPEQLDETIAFYMAALDAEPNQIDSVWYDWGEGNIAAWPSKVLPMAPRFLPQWWEAGLDPVQLLLEAARERGREVFFSHRINGADIDYVEAFGYEGFALPPMKQEHPEWLHDPLPALPQKHWNFAIPQVREYKVRVLRELAQNYEFDGISLDFARIPASFPAGEQWLNRDLLTDFIRQVRLVLLEVEQQRGRPFLLAVRIPENIVGCHFDGIDVERWAGERLVDILVLGCGAAHIDLPAFRRITAGTGIKLYPSWDPIHPPDGYRVPPIEVWRGLYANWWRLGADGTYTFNLGTAVPPDASRLGLPGPLIGWEMESQLNRELGSPETLQYKDKVFIVERRGGSHGVTVAPDPSDWYTPRHMYFLTCMFAPLPTPLANDGKADTLLTLAVADDVQAASDRLEELTLRILLSNLGGQSLTEDLIEVRVNNLLLGPARVEESWLVFPADPRQLAVGDNLVGVRVAQRPPDVREEIMIEKVELHVRYN